MNETHSYHWTEFWHFNIGHLLIILGMFGSAVWWFISYDREITIMKSSLSSLIASTDKLVTKVEVMDNSGTRFSQRGIGKDEEFARVTDQRLLKLESFTSKFELMSYQVDEISNWVKTQREQVKKQ